MAKKGKFIVIEGPDGSGKSYQASLMVKYLEKQNIPVFLTEEPTSQMPIGKLIRRVLRKELSVDPLTLQFLFIADRQEHVKKVILPAIESGIWVVSDRYFHSTIAYGAMDIPFNWLMEISEIFLQPDVVFLLDASPEICLERINEDKTRNGSAEFFERLDKLKKIRDNYLKINKLYPNTILINCEKSFEEVSEEIKGYLI